MAKQRGRRKNASAVAERGSEMEAGVRCGRPGRRTAEERTRAIVELLAGKATVDQLAMRFGVQAATIEKWREEALEGVAQAMRRDSGKSVREAELEKKLGVLEKAFTRLAMKNELMERALSDRPTQPGKSGR